jgi:hypothetical protein
LGCDATLEHAEWGHFKVIPHEGKNTMVPHKKGCFTCVTAVHHGAIPKNADWDEFEPLLVLSPKCKEQLATWHNKLESGGVHGATFAPKSVQVDTDVILAWQEEMDINIVEGDGLAALLFGRGSAADD